MRFLFITWLSFLMTIPGFPSEVQIQKKIEKYKQELQLIKKQLDGFGISKKIHYKAPISEAELRTYRILSKRMDYILNKMAPLIEEQIKFIKNH